MKFSKMFKSVMPFANVLTSMIPSLYQGMDVVSRELVGFIPGVTRNTSAERAAVGEPVIYPVTPSLSTADIVPSMTVPEPADFTLGNGQIVITKSKKVSFGWTGEETKGLNNGMGVDAIQADLFGQALRSITNEIETDLATEAALNASRAYGTAGTTPFATNVGETAQLKKILDDNGAFLSDRSLVIDTSAGASLRTLQNLTRVNEAGTTMTLRDGMLLDLNRFAIRESAAVGSRAIGTANASVTTNATGYAIGATSITLAAAGTGTIIPGDYITFAGDTNKYLVVTGGTAGTAITIQISAPGLRVAIPAATTAVTVVARATRNIGFQRSALHLVARAPALPNGRDAAVDSMMITDARSGMTYEVRVYNGYRKVEFEVGCAWGVKAVKREHIAALLG